jgi:hypothetical protein
MVLSDRVDCSCDEVGGVKAKIPTRQGPALAPSTFDASSVQELEYLLQTRQTLVCAQH